MFKRFIMKKLYLLFTFISVSIFAQTSMTFTGSSYMYVKDRYVFVKNSIDMSTATSNIFLRQGGQLLQGETAATINKGFGALSVFQEGTTNNFAYNYWCSPVGNASATAGNEIFGIGMIYRPLTTISSPVAAVISAYSDKDGAADPLKISSRWIYTFNPGINYSDWDYIGGASTIPAGMGFTMKGTSGTDLTNPGELVANNTGSAQRYDFRGKPNSGDIVSPVLNGNQTLIGNPYPSAIDLSAFLTDNLNCTGIAYFWDHDKTSNSHLLVVARGGYGTYSPVSRSGTGIYVPATFIAYDSNANPIPFPTYGTGITGNSIRFFAPIGQGFMVEGNAAGSTVTMKNSYRVFQKETATTSVFGRSSSEVSSSTTNFLPETPSVSGFDYSTVSTDEVPQIRLNITMNNATKKQLVVGFDNNATNGVDRAMDAKYGDSPLSSDCFLGINNQDFVISVIDFDLNNKLPLVFKNDEQASYKLEMGDILNYTNSENLYVHDKIADTYVNLVNNSFEVTIPAGINNSQYELTFINASLSNDDFVTNDIKIFQNNAAQMLSIANPKLLDVASLKLYDVAGKLIISKDNLKAKDTYEFSTATLSDGVYVARLVTKDNKNVSQKVIISSLK